MGPLCVATYCSIALPTLLPSWVLCVWQPTAPLHCQLCYHHGSSVCGNLLLHCIANFATIMGPLCVATYCSIALPTLLPSWVPCVTWPRNCTEMVRQPGTSPREAEGTADWWHIVMSYFDLRKQQSWSWMLAQFLPRRMPTREPWCIIACTSHTCTDVKRRSSQTEREVLTNTDTEGLTILWGSEHFNLCICGAPFTLVTDHKLPEGIFSNHCQSHKGRWTLGTAPPGSPTTSSYTTLARTTLLCYAILCCPPTLNNQHQPMITVISFVSGHATPKATTLQQVKETTATDAHAQQVIKLINIRKWRNINKHLYKHFTTSETSSVWQVTSPWSSQAPILSGLIHYKAKQLTWHTKVTNDCMVNTKQLLWEVLFPDIDTQATELLANCIACQACTTHPYNFHHIPRQQGQPCWRHTVLFRWW